MSWRSEGWDKLKNALISKLLPGFCVSSYAKGVEDGADAILEGLKEETIIETFTEFPLDVTVPIDRKGYLVFIPD